jgi:uncharacterized protein
MYLQYAAHCVTIPQVADLLPRGIETLVRQNWDSRAVVVLEGLRFTGKTTLSRGLVDPANVRDLTDANELKRALADTRGWVESLPEGVLVDEAQLVPNLQLAIKRVVDDRNARPGQFLLTGSARLDTRELGGSDPLLGRVARLKLYPFAQCELAGHPLDVVDALFNGDPAAWPIEPTTRASVAACATAGGFMRFRDLPDAERVRALDDYVLHLFDGPEYRTQRDANEIGRLFRWLASRSSGLKHTTKFGEAVDLSRPTIEAYLSELMQVHLIFDVPGYRHAPDKRETETPRLFAADPSFTAARLSSDVDALFDEGNGQLLETFVANEITRLASWSSVATTLYHWRKDQHNEVDLVLEDRDGGLVGIEVKAARSAETGHFKGLKALRAAHPRRFRRGFVLHTGDTASRFDDDLWALPFSALWTIGDGIPTRSGSSSFLDRLAIAERQIVVRDASATDVLLANKSLLDGVASAIIERLERLKKTLETLGVPTTVTAEHEPRVTQDPPLSGEVVWSQTLQLVGMRNSRGLDVFVNGVLLGNGDVQWNTGWGVNNSTAFVVPSVVTVRVGDDHIATIDNFLIGLVDRLDEVVEALRQ